MDPIEETTAPTMTPEELKERLEQLKASATKEYSLKNYVAAADFFSEAAQAQDEINGEMSLANADLLYQYGRCLYHVAVARSDVLGGKVAAEEPKKKKRKTAPVAESSSSAAASAGLIGDAMKGGDEKQAGEIVEAIVEDKDGGKKEDPTAAAKPFFQITGDENFDDSEEEDDDEADAAAEEEEDDFAIAYEILDVARVLLGKTLEAAKADAGKSATESSEVRHVKERLADTHDLQAEISLENERFHDAINDTRDGLVLKLELFPQENSLIAEAHFKLSLALEFASVTSSNEEGKEDEPAQVDEGLRQEAATEMEKAIASCKLRISKEEAALSTLEPEKQEERKKAIAEVHEIVADMEQRLIDLRNPAVSLAGPTGPAGAPDGSDPLRGVLGAMLGESKSEQQKRIAAATQGANDLSGLVKHRKKPKVDDGPATNGASEGKGKRKAEDTGDEVNGKKAKVEDA